MISIRFLIKITVLFTSFVGSAAVHAKPLYLTCDFVRDGRPQPRKFALDEERGSAVIFFPETAESLTLRAQFTAQIVLFEIYAERYGINRTNLIGVRQAKVDGSIDEAQCRIETPVNRAF